MVPAVFGKSSGACSGSVNEFNEITASVLICYGDDSACAAVVDQIMSIINHSTEETTVTLTRRS